MTKRLSDEIIQRRQEAIQSPKDKIIQIENPAIENTDSAMSMLTDSEFEILTLFLIYGKPISISNIREVYLSFASMFVSLFMVGLYKIFGNKKMAFDGEHIKKTPFSFDVKCLEKEVSNEEDMKLIEEIFKSIEKIYSERHKFSHTFTDNEKDFLKIPIMQKIMKRIGISIPSTSKIKKDITNLKFLSFITEREDAYSKKTLYYLNPKFSANWEKRRLELSSMLKKQEINHQQITSKMKEFYLLYIGGLKGKTCFIRSLPSEDNKFQISITDYVYVNYNK